MNFDAQYNKREFTESAIVRTTTDVSDTLLSNNNLYSYFDLGVQKIDGVWDKVIGV
jgi:hypothetical protein